MFEKRQKGATARRGLYTPPAKQTRIVAASLAGKSNREIARQEGIKRDTVARILSQTEVLDLVEQYRQQVLLNLVPNCILTLQDKVLTKGGGLRKNVDWRMLIAILKGAQVLVPRVVQEQDIRTDEFRDWTVDELEHFAKTGEWPANRPK